MKKITSILLLMIVVCISGYAQKESGPAIYTDRNTYVGGETLLAKIFVPETNSSRIIYLDLVNQFGTRITGASLEIRNKQANGYLQLPDSLSSGIYMVRTYQKHTAQKIKALREIWISNRFDGLEKTSQINRIENLIPIGEKETNQIELEGFETKYPINKPITTTLRISKTLTDSIDGDLLISVAQTNLSFDPGAFWVQNNQAAEGMIEKKGVIISGTVTDRKTSELAANITVYLTIPDSIPGFQYYRTQTDGRFYFLLDRYYGSVQAVVQCFGNTPDQRLKIKLDDFFAESGSVPKLRQEPISENFRNSVTQDIEAVTFQKVFGQRKSDLLPAPSVSLETYPYYGKASNTADPQLFIDLPNFTEISRELLPGVKFRNYNNEPSLQVLNNPMRNYFNEMPLLLIDGIPVRDLNLIKGMGTADIDRVDICQSERFYGDLRFPGVVAIYTTKADYSMLPESDQLIRLKLETIQEPAKLAEPILPEPTVPDLRQVLYWAPSTKPTETLPVAFSTSSVLGQYKLVVRGRLKDGTLIYTEKQFEVK